MGARVKLDATYFSAIGANAVILPGVLICYHSIVGAGAVVTKDVANDDVVAGNPAASIRRKRDD